eukprot:COSAG01_NODE_12232_length_1776_cov_98.228267_1_plen_35_part_10
MHNDGAGVAAWHSNGALTAELDYAITIHLQRMHAF